MITLRPSDARGTTTLEWLDSKHSFSFGRYHDEAHMGFGHLRVINEDKITPGAGFSPHSHRDMEIISYVLEGALQHKDSLGNGSIIVPGDVQRMSAGSGIVHSEYNPLQDRPGHFLQIWILPEKEGIAPSYAQKNFTDKRRPGQLTLLASKDGRDGSLLIHQDAAMYVLDTKPGQSFHHSLAEGRMAWVQMARGRVTLNGIPLMQGGGAAVSQEPNLLFKAQDAAEILFFELAA